MLRKVVGIIYLVSMGNTSVQMFNDARGHVADAKRVKLINIDFWMFDA